MLGMYANRLPQVRTKNGAGEEKYGQEDLSKRKQTLILLLDLLSELQNDDLNREHDS